MFDETKPLSEIECYHITKNPILVRIEKMKGLFDGWFYLISVDISGTVDAIDEKNKRYGTGSHWLEWEV